LIAPIISGVTFSVLYSNVQIFSSVVNLIRHTSDQRFVFLRWPYAPIRMMASLIPGPPYMPWSVQRLLLDRPPSQLLYCVSYTTHRGWILLFLQLPYIRNHKKLVRFGDGIAH
jgi:hypothetical protein